MEHIQRNQWEGDVPAAAAAAAAAVAVVPIVSVVLLLLWRLLLLLPLKHPGTGLCTAASYTLNGMVLGQPSKAGFCAINMEGVALALPISTRTSLHVEMVQRSSQW